MQNEEKIEQSLACVYAALTYIDMKSEVDVEALVSGVSALPYAEADPFVKGELIYSLKNLNPLIALLNAHMRKWTFERLNRVEQALLLISCSRYFYVEPSIDKAIVIDSAVSLAHKYLEAGDYKFVNAILDKVLVRE